MSDPTVEDLRKAQQCLDSQNIPRPHYACTSSGWYKFNKDGTTERGEFKPNGKWLTYP